MPDILRDTFDDDGVDIASPPRVKSSVPSSASRHGHYHHEESNLLPFELAHNRNTDWIAAGGPALLVTYISVILIFLLTFLAFVPEPKVAWAMANLVHGIVSMVYLHWIKGNPADYMDGTQGEMNAMTCWEQIVSKPPTHLHLNDTAAPAGSPVRSLRGSATRAIKQLRSRDVLCVVPTLLAHAACHVADYQYEYALINVGVWAIVMLPKMPFMNGVRIFGINRTTGIDDGLCLEDECDECFDTEEETCGTEVDGQWDEAKTESKKVL